MNVHEDPIDGHLVRGPRRPTCVPQSTADAALLAAAQAPTLAKAMAALGWHTPDSPAYGRSREEVDRFRSVNPDIRPMRIDDE